ncbi:unnamed protein product [Blepharisma stoltei]|uniref:Endonuclease/exonuclease/phosphatase domain-containing protein n=1 Tax=Blepharisma stoltei TaxID=1481888 RepID=A0AAU9K4F0_9CILI|nr:unnamed protein product [Blepharisma stoltei]
MDVLATKRARRAENKVITIAHVNAHGIKQKKQQIKQFLEDTNAEILGASETHCSETDLLPSIDGYSWLHNPGSERSSGVGILFKKRLVTGETKLFMKGRIVGISIANLTVIEAYSPVEGDGETLEQFYEGINEALAWGRERKEQLIIIGDLNAHVEGWWSEKTNENGYRVKRLCKEWGLELLKLDEPTHLHSSGSTFCLDYCAADWGVIGRVIDFGCSKNNPIGSDHLPITLKLWERWEKERMQFVRKLRIDRLRSPVYLKVFQDDVNYDLKRLD